MTTNLIFDYTDEFTDSDQALLDELFGTDNQDEAIAQWAGLTQAQRDPTPSEAERYFLPRTESEGNPA